VISSLFSAASEKSALARNSTDLHAPVQVGDILVGETTWRCSAPLITIRTGGTGKPNTSCQKPVAWCDR
jgi:hypothetical protein